MRSLLSLALVALVASGCGTANTSANRAAGLDTGTRAALTLNASALNPSASIVTNAAGQPELSALVAAIQRAGLVDALNGPGPFTVFAPVNAAFEDVDASTMDMDDLQNVLTYHVVEGRYSAGELQAGSVLRTLQGEEITIGQNPSDPLSLYADDADIIYADIEASNGVIHLVNLVLTPEPGGQSRQR